MRCKASDARYPVLQAEPSRASDEWMSDFFGSGRDGWDHDGMVAGGGGGGGILCIFFLPFASMENGSLGRQAPADQLWLSRLSGLLG